MNILFITQLLPQPARSGGRFKTQAILKILSHKHDVYLVCFHDGQHKNYSKDSATLQQQCNLKNVKSFYRPEVTASMKKIWMLFPTTFFSHKPFIVSKYFDKRLAHHISDISKKIPFDVVYLDHDTSYQYLKYVFKKKSVKVIYDEHNINSLAMWRNAIAKKSNFFYKLPYYWDSFRFFQYEKKIVNTVDKIATVSINDKKLIEKRGADSKNVEVLPIPIAPKKENQKTKNNIITFIGVLSWPPNRFGIQWFYKQVWPLIRNKAPNTQLAIIGAGITNETKKMIIDDKSVIYTGELMSLKKWYQQTKVVIIPIWMGSGIRIKLLEAMSKGKAIVSTTIGAEGIVNHKTAKAAGILLADSPEEFSKKVVNLLVHDKERKKNGEKALKYISKYHASDNSKKVLYQLLK